MKSMTRYATLYHSLLWPVYEQLRGRRTHRLLEQAEQHQWLAPLQIRDQQWAELQRLLQHVGQHSPWYRDQFQRLAFVPAECSAWEDFQKLPPLTKEDIRNHRQQILAENYQNRVFEHRTGGSTGTPVRLYLTRETYEWRNAITLRGYSWAGAVPGEKVFYLWSVPVGTIAVRQRAKEVLDHALARQKMFNNFRLSKTTLPHCLETLNRFRPKVLVGYTSMLEYLARFVKRQGGLRVKFHSIITAAEGVNADQRALLREVFQAPVFASYGSREFKLIAMECERGGLHISADNLIVECLRHGQPAGPGEPGQLLITDLHNYGFPLLRYQIGDVGALRADACSCGRGLPLLEAVHGRIPDTLQSPDGRLISGIFFPHLLRSLNGSTSFR